MMDFRVYIEVYVSTGTEEQHNFDIVEKIEMVSERRWNVLSSNSFVIILG
jgi:hypothetical protein